MIELNTSGLRYKLNSMHPSTEILKRYFELGGKIITIGSDAHFIRDLCAGFDKAIVLLKEIGCVEKGEVKVTLVWDFNALGFKEKIDPKRFDVCIPSEGSVRTEY